MRLDEITKRELQTLSQRSTKWADELENYKPKKVKKKRNWWEDDYDYKSMDLSEVLGPYLEKKGLKHLGEGAFAVVYGRPGANRVVKISQGADRCWLKYANWAMGQQHKNPHVPDIHHLETYTITSTYPGDRPSKTPVFFAVMEKLLPFERKNINFKDESNIALLAYLATHEGFPHFTKMRKGMAFKGHPFKRPYDHWNPDPKYMNRMEKFAEKGEKHEVIKLFKQVESKWRNCEGDFHDGNIMIRPSTGEFVITDPVAG